MSSVGYDLVVIGGGPAGYVGAIRAAQLGKRVVLVEKERPGGTCLHWGCIPTKSLLRSAELFQQIQRADQFGLKVSGVEIDLAKIVQRSRGIADRLTKGIEGLLRKHQIELRKGIGTICGKGEVRLQEPNGSVAILETSHILLATGAKPRSLPSLPVDGERILTSKEAMTLSKLPRSIVIVGAGSIGVEFAYFFRVLGSEVTLVELQQQILPFEDWEIARELTRNFNRSGMEVLTETKVDRVEKGDSEVSVHLTGNTCKIIQAEKVLVAVGLEPQLDAVLDPGLELARTHGFVWADERYQTSLEGVYGAGDIIGAPWLAHVASYEAIQAVEGMFGKTIPRRVTLFPSCIYCQPQVASVGLSEQKAQDRKIPYRVGKFPFLSLGKALAAGDHAGFVKILFAEPSGEILGAHIIGAEATELISEVNLGMTLSATRNHIIGTLHAHPSLSEALGEAAAASIGEAIHV